jgi:hypothetical protein
METITYFILAIVLILVVVLFLFIRHILGKASTGYAISREYTISYEITQNPEESGYTDLSKICKTKKTKKKSKR